jgi:hypothetical protein
MTTHPDTLTPHGAGRRLYPALFECAVCLDHKPERVLDPHASSIVAHPVCTLCAPFVLSIAEARGLLP